jgi:hypothetical protein
MLKSGRFLLHDAWLYNKAGRTAIRVTNELLELDGVTF